MKFLRILLLFLFVFNHNICNSYSKTNDHYNIINGFRPKAGFYPRLLLLYGVSFGTPYETHSVNFISDIQIRIPAYNLLLLGLQLTYQKGAEYKSYTNDFREMLIKRKEFNDSMKSLLDWKKWIDDFIEKVKKILPIK